MAMAVCIQILPCQIGNSGPQTSEIYENIEESSGTGRRYGAGSQRAAAGIGAGKGEEGVFRKGIYIAG